MKKTKKLFALLMMASLTVTSLAGCGPKEKSAADNDDMSKPYEIIWYYVGPSNNDTERIEVAVNEYLKDKINVTVQLNPMEFGPYNEKMKNIMTSNEKYDIRYVNNDDYVSAAYNEAFLDISGMIDDYMPKTKKLLGDDILKGVTIDGKIYGIPAYKDMAHEYSIVYRKDVADKLGIDMSGVKTFDDLMPIFEQIKQKQNELYPFVLSDNATPLCFENMIQVQSVAHLHEDADREGQVYNLYESEEYKNSAKKMYELTQKGYVPADGATLNNKNELKSQGRVFSYIELTNINKITEMNTAEKVKGSGWEYATIPMSPTVTSKVDTLGSIQAVSRTCENPVRVLKFLELVNTDPMLNNLLCYGVEGTDYEKIDKKTIRVKDDSGYNGVGWQWVFGNIFNNYIVEGDDSKKYDKLDAYNKSSEKSKYLGFLPNLESVKIEITACSNVIKEYNRSISMGAVDPEVAIPQYIEKLKQAGSEKIIDEVQRQYDEWKKGN